MDILAPNPNAPKDDNERAIAIWSSHYPKIKCKQMPDLDWCMEKDEKVIAEVIIKTVDRKYEDFLSVADYVLIMQYFTLNRIWAKANSTWIPIVGIVYFPKSNAIIHSTIMKDGDWKVDIKLLGSIAKIVMENAVILKG